VASLRFGYNTNGFPHHRLEDALRILADLGYEGVALTLDVHHLDPFHASPAEVASIAGLLGRLRLEPVVETGARFILDPRRKHEPNLLASRPEDRGRRLDFLRRACRMAVDLGASVVSLWSGRPPEGEDREDLEPEPGMLIQTLPEFDRIRALVDRPNLGLCLDVGHLYCTGETPVAPRVRERSGQLLTVHIEDCPRGRHEHRMFGEGAVDLAEALLGFRSSGYSGLLNVELSRHGHEAPVAAERAIRALREEERKLPG
jgi:sugar phosphate isomerase/epimerase